MTRRDGLTLIVPTFRGRDHLPVLLDSLTRQTAPPDTWEAVIVLNGPDDGTAELLRVFETEHPALNIRRMVLEGAGASRARNVGLACAQRSHIAFVDDDDWLRENFIAAALQECGPDSVVLMPIADQADGPEGASGPLDYANSLNLRIGALAGQELPLRDASWALGFNACKIIPRDYAARYRYDQQLRSGEDVVFHAHLLKHEELRLRVPKVGENASYVRLMRNDSVSRREDSFEFNVEERLECIGALQRIDIPSGSEAARQSLERSQFEFVRRYLNGHPDDYGEAVRSAVRAGAAGLPWRGAQTERARRLVISFNFPPFADPAANVAAKRIAERGEIVDVISGDMTEVRDIDSSSLAVAEGWIAQARTIRTYPSFAQWSFVDRFARKAVAAARGSYDSLYTRAMWSGSHVAGCLYKLKHPSVEWEAEFSDPMRWDATGEPRAGEIGRGGTARALQKAVRSSEWPDLPWISHFDLTECATLILADTVTFTNANQRDVVLSAYPDSFQAFINQKSRIAAQPVLPRDYYHSRDVKLPVKAGVVNIGYFGNFYGNRGLGDILEAARTLPADTHGKLALHVFSKSNDQGPGIDSQGSAPITTVFHEPLPYLSFLNACTALDALLVVDASTESTAYDINPFLPSKFADYAGSGTPVWAVVEPGSPLSESDVAYKTVLGDVDAAAEVLGELALLKEAIGQDALDGRRKEGATSWE